MVLEVKVSGLAFDPRVKSHVVVLKELEGERVLPIWIGTNEAQAIARELAGQRFQRPLTHDLFANIIVEHGSEVLSVDARPSDSIAIALRAKAPIFVDDRLLEHQPQLEKSEEEKAEELRRYLENLDPEDFGKYNP